MTDIQELLSFGNGLFNILFWTPTPKTHQTELALQLQTSAPPPPKKPHEQWPLSTLSKLQSFKLSYTTSRSTYVSQTLSSHQTQLQIISRIYTPSTFQTTLTKTLIQKLLLRQLSGLIQLLAKVETMENQINPFRVRPNTPYPYLVTKILKEWFDSCGGDVDLVDGDVGEVASRTGLTESQVLKWFHKQKWKSKKERESSWNGSDSESSSSVSIKKQTKRRKFSDTIESTSRLQLDFSEFGTVLSTASNESSSSLVCYSPIQFGQVDLIGSTWNLDDNSNAVLSMNDHDLNTQLQFPTNEFTWPDFTQTFDLAGPEIRTPMLFESVDDSFTLLESNEVSPNPSTTVSGLNLDEFLRQLLASNATFNGYDDYDSGFFQSPFNIAPSRGFVEHYRCYSISMMPGNERQDINYGGKIILPQSALAKLAGLNIVYPMLFQLSNMNQTRKTHAGVLEFVAEEGKVYIPQWMMQTLLLEEGALIRITNASLPLGTFVKIQPQSVDFLDISDPKAVLENALRNFTTLTKDDIITIKYNEKFYDILVMECKPVGKDGGISVIETDLEVDFAAPLGYVEEPRRSAAGAAKVGSSKPNSIAGSLGSIDQHLVDKTPAQFQAFKGAGSKLNGKGASSYQPATPTPAVPQAPAVLQLPENKLFFGYPVVPLKSKQDERESKETKPTFTGAGQTLRSARQNNANNNSSGSSSKASSSKPSPSGTVLDK
ncbi:ubiquitin fusion degradation protein [Nowakowskiella sp. JEL0407]|nr:ubiquitin fusion degradation protein [Nowakowskiella sp. JEL0407]